MLGSLLKNVRYRHISILRKYNIKSHYRYKQADKFFAQHNFQNIKNFKDYWTKPKEIKNVQLTLSEEQEQYVRETYTYQRPTAAWTKQIGLNPYRVDDYQIQQPIQQKTIKSFIKQAISQRKPHQLLFFYIIGGIIINLYLYFYFWYGSEDEDYIANIYINPEVLQTYNFKNFEIPMKEYKRRMGIFLEDLYSNKVKKD